jgi:hypothetical protein
MVVLADEFRLMGGAGRLALTLVSDIFLPPARFGIDALCILPSVLGMGESFLVDIADGARP